MKKQLPLINEEIEDMNEVEVSDVENNSQNKKINMRKNFEKYGRFRTF